MLGCLPVTDGESEAEKRAAHSSQVTALVSGEARTPTRECGSRGYTRIGQPASWVLLSHHHSLPYSRA